MIVGIYDVIKTERTLFISKSIPNSYRWILANSGHSTAVFYKDISIETVNQFFQNLNRKIEALKRME